MTKMAVSDGPDASGDLKKSKASLPQKRGRLAALWPWFCAVVTGILLALCFPNWNQNWLAWLAFTPLLCALFFANGERRRWLRDLGLGYVSGLTFFWISFDWLQTVTVAGWFIVAFYLALFFAMWTGFVGLILRFQKTLPTANGERVFDFLVGWRNLRLALFCAASWTAFEWLRGWLFSGFGWNDFGVALHGNLALIQIVAISGVGGLSFLLMFANVIAVITVRRLAQEVGKTRIRPHYDFTLTVALVVLVFGFGVHELRKPPGKTIPLRVAAVQANIPQNEKYDQASEQKILQRYETLTRAAIALRPQLLLWPEAAVPDDGMFASETNYNFVRQFVANDHLSLLLGTIDSDAHGHFYNAAVLLNRDGYQEYQKIHLVPFGEYIPFRHSFPLFAWIVGNIVPDDFTEGSKCTVFTLRDPAIKIAPLICFEDTLGDLARRFVQNGAQVFVNLTNDGWFQHSQESEEQLANAIFRAVEAHRPLLRCANTGVTCFIDARGQIQKTLRDSKRGTFTQGFLFGVVPIPLTTNQTFYVRHGEFFSECAAALTLLAMVVSGWKIFRKK